MQYIDRNIYFSSICLHSNSVRPFHTWTKTSFEKYLNINFMHSNKTIYCLQQTKTSHWKKKKKKKPSSWYLPLHYAEIIINKIMHSTHNVNKKNRKRNILKEAVKIRELSGNRNEWWALDWVNSCAEMFKCIYYTLLIHNTTFLFDYIFRWTF